MDIKFIESFFSDFPMPQHNNSPFNVHNVTPENGNNKGCHLESENNFKLKFQLSICHCQLRYKVHGDSQPSINDHVNFYHLKRLIMKNSIQHLKQRKYMRYL